MSQLHTPAMFARYGALALALALSGGCDDEVNTTTVQLNLDRPVDVAFACYGGLRLTDGAAAVASQEIVTSAQPLVACDRLAMPRKAADAVLPAPGQEDLTSAGGAALPEVSYYGLIVQSGPGTVALARFPATQASTFDGTDVDILDADPLTPGKNSISVGTTPVAIATDKSGCHAITANAGSRDLSVLDLNSALRRDGFAKVSRLNVTNAGTAVTAAPAALAVAPGPKLDKADIVADPEVVIGRACPGRPVGIAYVAYPECRAVAAVNLATGAIVKGIAFDAAGVATVVDPGAAWGDRCGGAAMVSGGAQPSALDLVVDVRSHAASAPRRLAIGARGLARVTVVELDAAALPTAVSQVSLFDATGTLGVLDIALSPHVGMGGSAPDLDNKETGTVFQFAYAVATDGTVRVASVLGADKRECDTQLDPRFQRSKTVDQLACLPLAGIGNPRRVGASGPGIALPSEGVASAVSIMRIDLPPEDTRSTTSSRLIGTFAFIASTTGATYIADLDDDLKADVEETMAPLAIDLATTAPHQLRDLVNDRKAIAEQTPEGQTTPVPLCSGSGPGLDSGGGIRGGARLGTNIAVLSSTDVMANLKRNTLPALQHFRCVSSLDAPNGVPIPELSFAADATVREDRFADTRALASAEDWRVVWEGPLSGDSLITDNNGPLVRQGTLSVSGQDLKMSDPSRPFCAAGVEQYDIVQLRGCDPQATTSQCPVGTKCYVHPDSTLGTGSCLPEKTADRLAETCRRFLITSRTYGVSGTPDRGVLALLPRPRVLRSTPITGCTDNQQCADLAGYEATLREEAHPFAATATANRRYECEPDDSRKPVSTNKRCVMTCTRDADCDPGTLCIDGPRGPRCMESVLPPAQCITALQRYELRVSESLVVLGSQSGYRHAIIADSTGKCVRNPNAHPLDVGRVPLSAPPCTGDGLTDLLPNPCSTTVPHTEIRPLYLPGTCDAANPDASLVPVATPAIRFRGPGFTFHLVRPTYPGDARCRGDEQGFRVSRQTAPVAIAGVPFVHAGYAMTFRIAGGYSPMTLRTGATMPVRILRGPQQSIWVVDEGDFLSDSPVLPSTRGKVYRIESDRPNIVNVMQ